jgi:hypothetical protein
VVVTSSGDTEEFRLNIKSRAPLQGEETQAAETPDPMAQVYTSTVDPTINDDSTDGHWVGRQWLNTATQNLFTNITNTAGAARWQHHSRTWTSTVASATLTGTLSETLFATQTFSGGTLGVNGCLEAHVSWLYNNNANVKSARLRFGALGSGLSGTTIRTSSLSAGILNYELYKIRNTGSQSSQKMFHSPGGTYGLGLGLADAATAAIDTSAAFEIAFTGALANVGDSLTLNMWEIRLTRPDIAP